MKKFLSWIAVFIFAVCFKVTPAWAWDAPLYMEDFEGVSEWSAENGVWEIGAPADGPAAPYNGLNCAGTILDGDYPAQTDSRLIGPYISPWEQGVDLPETDGQEELHLRFWHWFSYSSYDSGRVQISIKNAETGLWGDWIDIGSSISSYSGGWTLKDIEISEYAGQTIRIGFLHVAGRDAYNRASESSGWFLDDIRIIKKMPQFTGDFEMGLMDWSAETGVWQVGTPSSGPAECYEGDQCAGTVLDGNYPAHTDSRLVSATMTIDEISDSEALHLRFRHWFSYSSYDSGQVQISIKNAETGLWGDWIDIGSSISSYSGGWTLKDIEISEYAGQTIRIGFLHVAGRDSYNRASEASGWFLDDIRIIKKIPQFTGDFEMGLMDWSAETGVWQVGTPSSGPAECYEGDQCAGTVLDGNYPAHTDSRLISAAIDLSNCSASIIYLSFWEWFSYSSYDYGEIQISVWDLETNSWSDWECLVQSTETSPAWTHKYVDLSYYVGKIIRIGFFHIAGRDSYNRASESHGWFLDNIELVGPTQIMPVIESISFIPYIPECNSLIDVFGNEPFGEALSFSWQLPDGGLMFGDGANMEFIPEENKIEPYRVRVAASSTSTHISSFSKLLYIFTEVLYDFNIDKDIDGVDVLSFASNEEINETTVCRLAKEFGMVACER